MSVCIGNGLMGKSLQDQLLSLGLARDKPEREKKNAGKKGRPEKARGAGHKKRPAGGSGSHSKDKNAEMSLDRAYALRRKEEQQQAESVRKLKQEEVRRRRRLNREIGAIVNNHRLNDPKAEVPRNFMYKGRIRKIYLTSEQLKALNDGELGIAYLTGSYHLLAREHVEAVRQLSVEHVPELSGEPDDDEEEFPVPDDLVW